MGGLSSEREVSLQTGKAVLKAFQQMGLKAVGIDVDHNIAGRLKSEKIDLAFIALHGTYGEDGCIQGLLEYMKIPYTGSGVFGSALAFNKVASKQLFLQNGIPTAEFKVMHNNQTNQIIPPFDLPVVVKPSNQGSSVGVTIVREKDDWHKALKMAFDYSHEVLVENFIEGELLAVGMRGESPLPIVHIVPKSGFYDYEAKYTPGKTEYHCPANMNKSSQNACDDVSIQVFRVLQARGISRVDVILDESGTPYVLELNTIPGMTPTSLLPKAARQAGIEFEDLVLEMLNTAQLDNPN